MKTRSGGGASCLWTLLIGLLAAGIYTGARYLLNMQAYNNAHAAMLRASCGVAIAGYDRVIHAFQFSDLGGYAAASTAKRDECFEFQNGSDLADQAQAGEALSAYNVYLNRYPSGALVKAARERMAALLRSATPGSLATEDTCANYLRLAQAAGLSPADQAGALPAVIAACAGMYARDGRLEDAYRQDLAILRDYPASQQASPAAADILASAYPCSNPEVVRAEPVLRAMPDFLPGLFRGCGQRFEADSSYPEAAAVYNIFLEDYPDHPQVEAVKTALARVLIAGARRSGAGEIPAPEKVGGGSGDTTTLIIHNDSPEKMRIVLSGPATRIETLGACAGCQVYSVIGPSTCPNLGPVGTYTLPSGQYDVLVESTSGSSTIPFTGTWQLEGGEYEECFFIVRQ